MGRLRYFLCTKCQLLIVETQVKKSAFNSSLVHSYEVTPTLIVEHLVIEEA